ncbi:DNase I-like protein [Ceraceosorus guamensis]|uniref:DNase I-like protein n=1 Tax=Ceraceosorus guamensis TaxID=1522189 RepID=A0A316W489_9BASI|nr:DNase I-like protein [Ceraceosorus guamensis]PWN44364.1 DNase I-like protein [Ceraceosorus guamensis]
MTNPSALHQPAQYDASNAKSSSASSPGVASLRSRFEAMQSASSPPAVHTSNGYIRGQTFPNQRSSVSSSAMNGRNAAASSSMPAPPILRHGPRTPPALPSTSAPSMFGVELSVPTESPTTMQNPASGSSPAPIYTTGRGPLPDPPKERRTPPPPPDRARENGQPGAQAQSQARAYNNGSVNSFTTAGEPMPPTSAAPTRLHAAAPGVPVRSPGALPRDSSKASLGSMAAIGMGWAEESDARSAANSAAAASLPSRGRASVSSSNSSTIDRPPIPTRPTATQSASQPNLASRRPEASASQTHLSPPLPARPVASTAHVDSARPLSTKNTPPIPPSRPSFTSDSPDTLNRARPLPPPLHPSLASQHGAAPPNGSNTAPVTRRPSPDLPPTAKDAALQLSPPPQRAAARLSPDMGGAALLKPGRSNRSSTSTPSGRSSSHGMSPDELEESSESSGDNEISPSAAGRAGLAIGHAHMFSSSLISRQISSGEAPHFAASLPDASRINRRPPSLPSSTTILKNSFVCAAQRGKTLVTAHHSGEKLRVYRVGVPEGRVSLESGWHVNCLLFVPPAAAAAKSAQEISEAQERWLWAGTKEGHVLLVDCVEARVVKHHSLHGEAIRLLRRVGSNVIAVDEGGKISVWPAARVDGSNLDSPPITQRISLEKASTIFIVGDQLWVSCGPDTRSGVTSSGAHAKSTLRIRVFNPLSETQPFNAVSRPVGMTPDQLKEGVGAVTAGTVIPSHSDKVYLAHDSGHISVWSRSTYSCVVVQKVLPHGISALLGVDNVLWMGSRDGFIHVLDVSGPVPWVFLKRWNAGDPVVSLQIETFSLEIGQMVVLSTSSDSVRAWDGTLAQDYVDQRLSEPSLEARFSSFRHLRLLQVSYNIDSASPEALNTADSVGWLRDVLTSTQLPDVIVFGLQEVVDLTDRKVGAKSLLLGSKAKHAPELADRISTQYRAWEQKLVQSVRAVMPPEEPYDVIAGGPIFLVGLFQIVFVRRRETASVKHAAVATVKTGFGGRAGNKGATITRFVLDDTSIAFANCHLAAGQSKVKQRNADLAEILEATPFDGILADPSAFVGGGDGAMLYDHELLFLSGDLNYRIDEKRSACVAHVESGRLDPLLTKDQLLREMRHNPTFRLRGFQEAPITFPPTYKYVRNSTEWDNSAKMRVPAWCDRILWLGREADRVRSLQYRRWEPMCSDHRPISAAFDIRIRRDDLSEKKAAQAQVAYEWQAVQAQLLKRAISYYTAYL